MARRGVRVQGLTPARKAEITAACERLIAATKARYLPEIRPNRVAYAVDMRGRWRGEAYTFAVRFRSAHPDAIETEYDAPYARLDHMGGRFGVQWMRHTGRWWPLRDGLTLEEAIEYIATEGVLRPPI
jgi:hypothetical protein